MENTTVLIVGAGPTGLTLACELARRHVAVRIIERLIEPACGSRAKGVQPRSLEILNDLGITETLIPKGYTDLPYRKYNENQLQGDVPRKIFDRKDTRYPGILLLPQYEVEAALRNKLAEFGIKVEWATELADFTQLDKEIICRLEKPGKTLPLSCQYIVGCDGGKSTVRKELKINFIGETYQTEQFWVGDVELTGLTPDAWYNWFKPGEGLVFALFPFKNSKSWQLQAPMKLDVDGNIAPPTLEDFNELFKERTQMQNVILTKSTWQSVYRINVRRAERFRERNVFLAGDACHVHSAAGGMGMNTGIQDAYNLGWKLASVINGEAKDHLLDTYEEERIPVADWLLKTTSSLHQNLKDVAKTGKGGVETMASADNTQLNINYRNSSLTVKSNDNSNTLKNGDRAPDVQLADGNWLSDQWKGIKWSVLVLGNVSIEHGDIFKTVRTCDQAVTDVYGILNGLVLIRPDGYIALMTADVNDIEHFFGQTNPNL